MKNKNIQIQSNFSMILKTFLYNFLGFILVLLACLPGQKGYTTCPISVLPLHHTLRSLYVTLPSYPGLCGSFFSP